MGRLLWFIARLYRFPLDGLSLKGISPLKRNRRMIIDAKPVLPAGHFYEFDSAISYFSKLAFLKKRQFGRQKDLRDV